MLSHPKKNDAGASADADLRAPRGGRNQTSSTRKARRAVGPCLGLILLGVISAARADSLWPAQNTGASAMVSDRKAARTGDILTVVVAESAAATNSQSASTNRASSVEDAINRYLFSPSKGSFGTYKGETPATSAEGKASTAGGGAVANTQSLSSRAAVLVADVLPNGNLVIEGVRVVTFSGETQYVVLHGLVRPDDISSANTVFSTNIADARVEFIGEGKLTDAQKRGWLTKLYERLRPL
jgi:flagellar L-ring protein precursor FlgH